MGIHDDKQRGTDREARLRMLGMPRLRLLDCMGGNSPGTPGYFDPPEDANVFAAFARYAERLWDDWGTESDPLTLGLLGAARLLSGDLAGADLVLENLPADTVRLDHGAGHCLLAAQEAFTACLPLPAELRDASRFTAGSTSQQQARAWLATHSDKLHWKDAEGVYGR